jgi:phage gp46-like protein
MQTALAGDIEQRRKPGWWRSTAARMQVCSRLCCWCRTTAAKHLQVLAEAAQ